jgi:hypothetical protein
MAEGMLQDGSGHVHRLEQAAAERVLLNGSVDLCAQQQMRVVLQCDD